MKQWVLALAALATACSGLPGAPGSVPGQDFTNGRTGEKPASARTGPR